MAGCCIYSTLALYVIFPTSGHGSGQTKPKPGHLAWLGDFGSQSHWLPGQAKPEHHWVQWRMPHCQNHHFKTIYSGNGNLVLGPLQKIGALSHTSQKIKSKFPRWLVELWMCLSQHLQQHYSAWHLSDEFELWPMHFLDCVLDWMSQSLVKHSHQSETSSWASAETKHIHTWWLLQSISKDWDQLSTIEVCLWGI